MKISLQWMERLYVSTAISHFHRTFCYHAIIYVGVGGLIDRRFESSQSLRFMWRRGHAQQERKSRRVAYARWLILLADPLSLPATGNRWKRGTRDDDRSNEWYANINFVFPDSCLSRGQSDFWMGLDVMAASSPFSGILSLCPSHCIDLPHLSIESILFWLLFFLARFLSLYKVIDLINVLTISPLYFILKFLLSTFLVEIFINSDPIFFSVGGLFTNLLSWDWVNSIILQRGDG